MQTIITILTIPLPLCYLVLWLYVRWPLIKRLLDGGSGKPDNIN